MSEKRTYYDIDDYTNHIEELEEQMEAYKEAFLRENTALASLYDSRNAYRELVASVKDTLNKAGESWDPYVAHAVVSESKQTIKDFESKPDQTVAPRGTPFNDIIDNE